MFGLRGLLVAGWRGLLLGPGSPRGMRLKRVTVRRKVMRILIDRQVL